MLMALFILTLFNTGILFTVLFSLASKPSHDDLATLEDRVIDELQHVHEEIEEIEEITGKMAAELRQRSVSCHQP